MLLKVLDGMKCFVDIGTYLGWYTCLASKHMPQGKVFAFEMDELNYALLKENLIINDCKNVEAHNLAVSDSSGMLNYMRAEDHPSPLFRLNTEETISNSSNLISVGAITLDCFFQNKDLKPDVIKIDVEGAEMNVLRGMRGLIEKYKPSMFLEIHPLILPIYNSSASAILSLLMKSGYKIFEIDDMRCQESCKKLNELSSESVLERNSMIYAVAPK
jgi:FkbM family methyltransferase